MNDQRWILKPKYRLGHPKSMYFHYLRKHFLDQSIQNTLYLILKTEALMTSSTMTSSRDQCSCMCFLKDNACLSKQS